MADCIACAEAELLHSRFITLNLIHNILDRHFSSLQPQSCGEFGCEANKLSGVEHPAKILLWLLDLNKEARAVVLAAAASR